MRVVQIWRYPVKSLAGEPLRSARLESAGLPHDRRYVLLDSDPHRPGKHLTARVAPQMLGFGATVRPDGVHVRTPLGHEYPVDDTRWLADLEKTLGKPITLRHADEPVHDDADVLVVNAASVRALAGEYGAFVHPIRFRPNFIVDGPEVRAFEEGEWVGSEVAVADAVLKPVARCVRCVVTTIDPETLASDPAFLRLLAEKHEATFGVYCKVVRTGDVRLGDRWHVGGAAEVSA